VWRRRRDRMSTARKDETQNNEGWRMDGCGESGRGRKTSETKIP